MTDDRAREASRTLRSIGVALLVAALAFWLLRGLVSEPSGGRGWPSGICDTPGCWHG